MAGAGVFFGSIILSISGLSVQATYTIICELVTFCVSRVILTSRYGHILLRSLHQVCQAHGCAIYFQNVMQILGRH
jgi:hypothetical protein